MHAVPTDAADPFGELGIGQIRRSEEVDELHASYLPRAGKFDKPSAGSDAEKILRHFARMGNQLRTLRLDRGWTHQEAADAMAVSRDHFIKLERGSRNLTSPMIAKAALAFGVSQSEIIAESDTVPIVGLVGAGGNATITFINDGELGRAPKPPAGNDRTVAVEVRGTSMRGVADDGWLVFYDDVRSPLTEDMIGELCILWLADGQCVIKKPYPSRSPRCFDLESTSAETMRGVEVESAAFVTFLAPARTARLMVKRDS